MVAYDPYTAALEDSIPIEMDPLPKRSTTEEVFGHEKVVIASHEEGCDGWDEPVRPIGATQCALREYSLELRTLYGVMFCCFR